MGLPSVAAFERAGLKAWPGIEVEWDGAWVRRASKGYTKRANSAQCFDPEDDGDVERRIAEATDWFRARGLPPVFRMTPLTGPKLAKALAGWALVDASHLFAMELGAVEADERGRVYDLADPAFLAIAQLLQAYSDRQMEGLKGLLAMLSVPACGVVVFEGGEPVASGLHAIGDGVVISGNVVTSTTQRRKGYGAAMMRTGLNWARRNGAVLAALNVQADNSGAQALYAGLGYARQYDYHYYRLAEDARP